ncbi:Uncharacterised protein [Chlamydia abortus]|uniref:Cytochrome c oxidase subunit 2A n=1 Tax=Paenibacillus residui TaxID=629724 RepID=A0ABW3D8I7_9BACL|nr:MULTISPECIES: cytochrome c oxidase subunit 2A [Paenibacillaceae]SHE12438.1 Uncharacterised protein [Chlamydia abortus]
MQQPIATQKDSKAKTPPSPVNEEKETLKGTFAAVLMLGGFIALTWLGVFLLYIVRS